ncbi:MAG: SusD/RagB family nutrient-binding outer membrane lipoprotein, partial [Chitinophagaceae bacterium]
YNGLPSIYTQEWLALMTNPEEAWAMWKRTGYPQFNTDSVGSNSGIVYLENLTNGGQNMVIPRRGAFELSSSNGEATGSQLNQANFNTALQTLISKDPSYGPNGLYSIGRVWWDMP